MFNFFIQNIFNIKEFRGWSPKQLILWQWNPAEEVLIERAVARAEQLAAIPPATFWHTKWALRGPVLQRAQTDGSQTDAGMRRIWASAETAAAIADYVQRTIGTRAR